MVVRGEPWMIPALSRIWEACFGDSPEYIRFFMERRFPTCESFIWLEQGEPVGMSLILPCYIQDWPAFYGYAGGVLPEYRRRGIYNELVSSTAKFCKEKDALFVFVPSEGNDQYYARRGFQPAFTFCQLTYEKGQNNETLFLPLREADATQYVKLRDQAFLHKNYLRWDQNAVEYALEENRFCGGFAKIVTYGQDYLLFGRQVGGVLEIIETTLSPVVAEEIAPALCRQWEVEQIRFRFPEFKAEKQINGYMAAPARFQNGWLGLDLA